MAGTGWGIAVAGVLVAGIAVLGALGESVPLRLDGVVFVQPSPEPAWVQRIAHVDEALGRSELSRAIYEWREAYGAALGSRRSDALIAVGDRAIRIAELAGGSRLFLDEARHVYGHAVLCARAERSAEAIHRIADVFEKLGDTERARQVRGIAERLS